MNGTTLLQSPASLSNVSTVWSVAGTGDLNGDGMSDILWYNSGNISIWFMDGGTVSSNASVGNVSTDWMIQCLNPD